ncbi:MULTISPECIES: helix-turn-helix domain-containing protein [Bacillaceae]|jgi:transcriptional regulator with XRE-family HTH domain|uniref:helix-turn-helix domain-containing protein n=1 Tax=Bacillaceae TaxID=186817 RepID=UPI00101C13F1|nr:helix-turn-helix transcriptional regulator [Ectobacillus funiculus]
MHFGHRLRICREKKGLKQVEVAQIIGVANNTLSGYESGKYEPSLSMLIRLAELYEVPIEYIISGVKVSKSTSPDMQDLLGDISQLSQSDIELIKTLVERLKQK